MVDSIIVFGASAARTRNWHSNCFYVGRPLISALEAHGPHAEDVNAFTATRATLWQHHSAAFGNGGGGGRANRSAWAAASNIKRSRDGGVAFPASGTSARTIGVTTVDDKFLKRMGA
jgi:hypothetical protein